MVRPILPVEKNLMLIRSDSPAQPVSSIAVSDRQKIEAEKSNPEVKNDFSSEARLERQTEPSANRPLLLVHENLGPNRSMNVRAGYRDFWGDESVLRKISPDEQEPGFAYIQASFHF